MKIGLLSIDNHAANKKWGATIYPNLALCKIAAYHRAQGDSVEWAMPLFEHYDIIYRSKIFNFSEDDDRTYYCDREIRGGTGYNLNTLPQEIDDMQPDYSIFSTVPEDTSYGFLTRGCPNKCSWCVVPKKEGNIRPYWDIERVANGRRNVVLMDNNILAAGSYCMEQLTKIADLSYRIDFNQALDARLVTEENAQLLARIKWIDRIRFGCDTPSQIEDCERAITMISELGYKGEFFLYTMIGDPHSTFEKDFARINYWRKKNQDYRHHKIGRPVYPYAQPYRNPYKVNTPPQSILDLTQWCNKKMIFQITEFADFSPRIGFKCKEYFNL